MMTTIKMNMLWLLVALAALTFGHAKVIRGGQRGVVKNKEQEERRLGFLDEMVSNSTFAFYCAFIQE